MRISASSSGCNSHNLRHVDCMNRRVGSNLNVLTMHRFSCIDRTSMSSISLKSFIASSSVINVNFFIHNVLVLHEFVVSVFFSFSVHLFTDYNEHVRQVHYLLRTFPCSLAICVVKYDDCYVQFLCQFLQFFHTFVLVTPCVISWVTMYTTEGIYNKYFESCNSLYLNHLA